MKRSVTLVFVSFFILSCATAPSPKIEGNYYQNYQYGFALEMPGGAWKLTKKMPSQFKQTFSEQGVSSSKINLMLFNNETQAFITVYCDKRRISGDLSSVPRSQYLDTLRQEIDQEIEKERKVIPNGDRITSFTYNAWFDNSDVRWTLNLDYADIMVKSQTIGQGVMYQLGTRIFIVQVTLTSNILTYEQNLETFNQMWASLRYGEEYTAEGYQSK